MAVDIPATSGNIPGTLVLRDASGNVSLNGVTAADSGSTVQKSGDINALTPNFTMRRTRGTSSSISAVQNGDSLGVLQFQGWDGSNFVFGARILCQTDNVTGTTDMPTNMTFSTASDGSSAITLRMRITSSGDVGISTATPSSRLHVDGDLTVSNATTANAATAGTNGDVPAQVEGYLVVSINGTSRKIPYYAT